MQERLSASEPGFSSASTIALRNARKLASEELNKPRWALFTRSSRYCDRNSKIAINQTTAKKATTPKKN